MKTSKGTYKGIPFLWNFWFVFFVFWSSTKKSKIYPQNNALQNNASVPHILPHIVLRAPYLPHILPIFDAPYWKNWNLESLIGNFVSSFHGIYWVYVFLDGKLSVVIDNGVTGSTEKLATRIVEKRSKFFVLLVSVSDIITLIKS